MRRRKVATGSPDAFRPIDATSDRVGVGPRGFAELVRFHRFILGLPIGSRLPSWADLVAESPYYDQPHFIRAFRRFSGYTPVEYLARVVEFGPDAASFVPLDEVPGRGPH